MDPSQWGNLSGLGRLPTPVSSVTNAALGHYSDLSLIDQSFSTAAGLGALSPQLPLANPLSSQRVPTLSPASFAHSLSTPFLDTAASLAQSASHSPYKPLSGVGQPESVIHGLPSVSKGSFLDQDLVRPSLSVADAVRAWESRSFTSQAAGLESSATVTTPSTFGHDSHIIPCTAASLTSRLPEASVLQATGNVQHSQRTQPSPPQPPPAHSSSAHRSDVLRNPYQADFLHGRHMQTNPSPPTYLPQGTNSQLENLLMGRRETGPMSAVPQPRASSTHKSVHSGSRGSLGSADVRREPAHLQQSQYTPSPTENISYHEEIPRQAQQQQPVTTASQQYNRSPQQPYDSSPQQMPALLPITEQPYTGSPQMTQHTGSPQMNQHTGSPQMVQQPSIQQARKASTHRYPDSPQMIQQQHNVGNNSPMLSQSHSQSQQPSQYSPYNMPQSSYGTTVASDFGSSVLQSNIGYSSGNLETSTSRSSVQVPEAPSFGGSSSMTNQSAVPSQAAQGVSEQYMAQQIAHNQQQQQQQNLADRPMTQPYHSPQGVMEPPQAHQMALDQPQGPHAVSMAGSAQMPSHQIPMTSVLSTHPGIMSTSGPIQAIADSTTGPKKRPRKRKKDQAVIGDVYKHSVSTESDMPMQPYTTLDASAISGLKQPPVPPDMDVYMASQMNQGSNSMGEKYGDPMSKTSDLVAPPPFPRPEGMEHPDKVFMTNFGGKSFHSPSDELGPQRADDGMNEGHTISPGQLRTKAQQKEMPAAFQSSDEFSHLRGGGPKTDPPVSDNKPFEPKQGRPKCSGGRGRGRGSAAANANVEILSDPVPSASLPKPVPGQNTFMNSFLSFIQGQKGETLSSVTNSAVTERPPMPKYVPDPRPRKVETKSQAKDTSGDVPVLLASAGKKPKAKTGAKKSSVTSMDFSDDEEDSLGGDSQGLNAAVQNVLGTLSEDSVSETSTSAPSTKPGQSSSGAEEPPPLEVRHAAKLPRGRPPSNKKKGKAAGRRKLGKFDDDVIDMDVEEIPAHGIHYKEGEYPPPQQMELTPLREKSSRRAKEKVREKMNQRKQKRQKKGSKKVYEDDDFSSSDDFMAVSSGDEGKGYDSDKDPAWTPFATDMTAVRKPGSDSEDEGAAGRRKRGRRPGTIVIKTGRSKRRSTSLETAVEVAPSGCTVMAEPDELANAAINSKTSLSFKKGCFVVEKQYLGSTEEHPIWKIDAGKLLQKYEPFNFGGESCHKALCTYSSWTESIEANYEPVSVTIMDREVVKMEPIEPSSSGVVDKCLQKFNVYMQILVSQALEPGFLMAIREEGDDYYMLPLNYIDGLIEEKKAKLVDRAGWEANFVEQMETYPQLDVLEARGLTADDFCQASKEVEVRAEKLARLSGQPYDTATLEPQGSERTQEFAISSVVAELLPTIHSLHHLKYTLFIQCFEKVKSLREGGSCADDSEVLDQCLQNRDWVLQMFKSLSSLLEDEQT